MEKLEINRQVQSKKKKNYKRVVQVTYLYTKHTILQYFSTLYFYHNKYHFKEK